MILNFCLSILLPVLTLRVISAETGVQSSDQKALSQDLEMGDLNAMPVQGGSSPLEESKRASGFMPMRGRKDYFTDKRMNFMPMRGKKLLFGDFNIRPENEKRMNFMPMRGRKSGFEELYDSDNYGNPLDYEDGMSKRTSGFIPMRGKKDDKRAGFHALRGKKAGPTDLLRTSFGANRNWNSNGQGFENKRANAFFGMRGKRETNPELFQVLRSAFE